MTSTASTRTYTDISETLPKQIVENYTSSVTFMKQLTAIAVSTITYIKKMIPEDNYKIEKFAGLQIRTLKKNCSDHLAKFVSATMIQAFEAFDKKYLHQLVLCIYEDERSIENLIEYHIFEYLYHTEGVSMRLHSKNRDKVQNHIQCTFENVKQMTKDLLQSIIMVLTHSSRRLPEAYEISFRLYYNEDAPKDYQLPGFTTIHEVQDHLDLTLTESIKLGWVETPYHKLIMRTYIKDDKLTSTEAIVSDNPPTLTISDVDQITGSHIVTDDNRLVIDCPCNRYDDTDDYGPLILLKCIYCNKYQHAACFGLLTVWEGHCCAKCAARDPTRVTPDPRLAELTEIRKESRCMLRRAVEWCTRLSTIKGRMLVDRFGISDTNAIKLLKTLNSFNIVEPIKNIDEQIVIHANNLKAQMNKFFKQIDRL